MKIYLCGGAVRDKILGKEPKDFDYVVVGSTPAEMEALKFTQVGKDFPVYLHPETNEEYALARTERKSGLKHTEFETVFDSSITIEQDLARRDLTINSIAMDLDTKEFIDPFNGMQDIKNKVLRHTTDAFKEDPLRVLRLARFCAKFPDFSVAPETKEMIRKMVENGELNHLAQDRIWAESQKAFVAEHPLKFLELLSSIGALSYVCRNAQATFYDKAWLEKVFLATAEFEEDRKLLVRAGAFFSYYWNIDFATEKEFIQNARDNKLPANIITLAVFMGKFADKLSFNMTPKNTPENMVKMLDEMNIKGMVSKNPNFIEDMFLIQSAWMPENVEIYNNCKVIIEAYLDTKEFLSCMVKRHKWTYNAEPTRDDYISMVEKIKHQNVEAAIKQFFNGVQVEFRYVDPYAGCEEHIED